MHLKNVRCINYDGGRKEFKWAALFIKRLSSKKHFLSSNCLNNAVWYKYYVEFPTSGAVFPQAACFINCGGALAGTMPNDPMFFPAIWCNGMNERLPVWCMVSGHTAGHRDKIILQKRGNTGHENENHNFFTLLIIF